MFPIGLMLIAIDLPFLCGPVAHMIAWIERAVISMITLWEAVGARLRSRWSQFAQRPIRSIARRLLALRRTSPMP